MATRTVYTSTITVPVYGSWKCEECGEVNFATGVITCQRQESSSSWRPSKQREAEESAAKQAKAEWVENAYKIIFYPNKNAQRIRNHLFLQNTHCTKCGKKPKWDKDMKYLTLGALCFMPAIISGFVAFVTGTSVVAWLIFIALLAAVATSFISEHCYTKMMANLPKEYTPVLGSLNAELIGYAQHIGRSVPSPDETIAIVKGYDKGVNLHPEDNNSIVDVQISTNNKKITDLSGTVQCNFCRKCGTQLQVDSGFCHKCGTKIINQ